MGFYFFSRKDELVIKIEQDDESAYDDCPLWKQAQGPVEGNAAKKPKKQRRTKRRQQAAGVADPWRSG